VNQAPGPRLTFVDDNQNKIDVDVAIIGAGTAGMAAYRAAAKRRGANRVLLIEGGPYGTTCARVGCMPSKLLIAAAEAAHHAREAAPFGVKVDHAAIKIDGRAVMERVRKERDRFVGFVLDSIESFPAESRLRGRARFVGPNELEVVTSEQEKVRVTAKSFVIATGSSPFIPPVFDKIRDRLIINDDVFEWQDLPESVAVFGAGVIGLELGQALHRLGVRVRIFGRSETVGPLADPAVKASAATILKKELAVDFDAKVFAVEPGPDKTSVTVHFEEDGLEKKETFATALIAAGRRANVGNLGLECARPAGGPNALVDRHTLRWGDTHIFIAGDANDEVPLLHEAADEGMIAGENAALYPDVRAGKRRSGLAIAFTDPPIAIVGGGMHTLLARTAPYVVGEIDFANQGRSRVMLQNRGLGRLYADPKTRRFLGAEIVGPRAEHLAHLLAWAHQSELTVDHMLAMPFYHPVVEEGLRTALRDLIAKLDAQAVLEVASDNQD
jgi:dihydrolipoamide dehydrogenase